MEIRQGVGEKNADKKCRQTGRVFCQQENGRKDRTRQRICLGVRLIHQDVWKLVNATSTVCAPLVNKTRWIFPQDSFHSIKVSFRCFPFRDGFGISLSPRKMLSPIKRPVIDQKWESSTQIFGCEFRSSACLRRQAMSGRSCLRFERPFITLGSNGRQLLRQSDEPTKKRKNACSEIRTQVTRLGNG